MTKKQKQAEIERQAERDMRDRMNGIRRDENGVVTHRNNKPVEKITQEEYYKS